MNTCTGILSFLCAKEDRQTMNIAVYYFLFLLINPFYSYQISYVFFLDIQRAVSVVELILSSGCACHGYGSRSRSRAVQAHSANPSVIPWMMPWMVSYFHLKQDESKPFVKCYTFLPDRDSFSASTRQSVPLCR